MSATTRCGKCIGKQKGITMVKHFRRVSTGLSTHQIILCFIASWLSASAFMNWINHRTPNYFSLPYAGLEGSFSLAAAWAVFTALFSAAARHFVHRESEGDPCGRMLFASWLFFSLTVTLRLAQTLPAATLLILNAASLLLARDIYRSAATLRRPLDAALALGGLAVLFLNLRGIPWTGLIQELFLSLGMEKTSIVPFLMAYAGLLLVIGSLCHRDPKILKKPWFVPLIMALVFLLQVTALGRILYARVETLSTPTYDFNLFAQMFHSMAETLQPVTTLERNLPLSHFKVHFSPIFYLLLPVYLMFRSPAALNVTQGFIVAAGIIPMVLIARHFGFSKKLQTAFCIIYLASTALITSNFYDLHENVFLVPMLLWLIWAIETKNNAAMAAFTLLTLAVKEDAALYVWALAGFMLIDRKMIRQSVAMFLISGTWFIAALTYLNTYGDGAMTGRFQSLIAIPEWSLLAVPYALWRNPGFILFKIFQPGKLSYLIQMLAPLAFIPLLTRKLSRWILLVPFLLMNLMVDYQYQSDIRFQYNYGSYILLFYMTLLFIRDYVQSSPSRSPGSALRRTDIGAMGDLSSGVRTRLPLIPRLLLIAAMASGIAITGVHLKSYEKYPKQMVRDRDVVSAMKAVMDTIPPDASVLASDFLTGYLSRRETLHDLTYNVTSQDYYRADYIVMDLRPGYALDHEALIPRFLSDGYEITQRRDLQILVMRRTPSE